MNPFKKLSLVMAFTMAVVCGQSFAADAAQHHHARHAVSAKAHAKHHAKAHNAVAQRPLSDQEWAQIQDRFDDWLPRFRHKALAAGISPRTVNEALGHLKPIRTVVEFDRRQPESIMSFREYAQRAVDPRVAEGREMMRRYATELHEVEQRYGVPAEYIVALWGMETNYGTYQGEFNVPGALATLAVEGRRRDFFTQELMDALRLIDRGDVRAADMKGSWAGAMGNNQFMPSTLLKYGADGDGDGKVNIWSRDHLRDTFASSANKLVHDGWHPGELWGREVRLPEQFPKALINSGTISPIATWKGLGVTLANGRQLSPDESSEASLVSPGASRPNYPGGPIFLAYNNYRTLSAWNAGYFPAAIGLLADRIRLPEPRVATQ